ncbi:MAG: MerR family transcriptional regulator [Ruminiclostridium sp.]
MLINEVCKECKLTKKAIDYYEKQNLLQLKRDDNGYRLFSNDEIALLKEISILRKLGISISDIKVILTSADKHKALTDYKVEKEFRINQIKVQECLNYLLSNNYDIAASIDEIERRLDDNSVIIDKLLQAFPGNYGIYISLHFSRFLNEKIDCPEKVSAYYRIVEFIDNIDNMFPQELEQYLTEAFSSFNSIDFKKIDESMHRAINDCSSFIEENKAVFENYLEYRNSEEFKASPAYQLQQSLIAFQKSTGYYDVFIPNLKILSSSYREYCEKMMLANEQFFEEYPQAKAFYK